MLVKDGLNLIVKIVEDVGFTYDSFDAFVYLAYDLAGLGVVLVAPLHLNIKPGCELCQQLYAVSFGEVIEMFEAVPKKYKMIFRRSLRN